MTESPSPYEIPTVTLGPAEGPHLLITGGVHGDEFEPMAACRRLIQQLSPCRLRGRVTIAPVVNLPAFLRGDRVADDGLDLARSCPGQADGTITQQIAAALTRLIHSADYYIDLHTAGLRNTILPLAGYTLHPDLAVLDVQRTMAHAFRLPIIWGTNARLSGRSLSVARDANVPAIYVENGGGGGLAPDLVEQNVVGCLNVMRALALLDETPEPSAAQYVVEDDRDESGHLQAQLSSPCDGFFQPSLALGQVVQTGDTIGSVCDPLGIESHVVTAPDQGLILFLRRMPAVRRGDPLVALLPITEPGVRTYARQTPPSADG